MVLIIGGGSIASEYGKILKSLNVDFEVVTRSESSRDNISSLLGCRAYSEGLSAYIKSGERLPSMAIVAVNVNQLALCVKELAMSGVARILVEKPGGLTLAEIKGAREIAELYGSEVFVAYNRRFFSSVLAAQSIIEQDGGVTSFVFEITEWSHVIKNLDKPVEELNNWFLGNTSHVVDMAFHIGGRPKVLQANQSGQLDWHPAGKAFSGSGVTETGAVFSYHGDWASAGRWGVEVCTPKRRLIFTPLEELKQQLVGEVKVSDVSLNNSCDIEFKPGYFRQVKAFLYGDKRESLCSLKSHCEILEKYVTMAGYTK